jgi:hypothetical protein
MSKYYDPRFFPFGEIFKDDLFYPVNKPKVSKKVKLISEYLHNNKLCMLYKLNKDVTCNRASITDAGYMIGVKLDFVDSNGKTFYDSFELPSESYDVNSIHRVMLNDHLMLISIEVKSEKSSKTEKEF